MARRSRQDQLPDLKVMSGGIRQSMSDIVFETLREAILSSELPGGTPLIEAQLAKKFNVSKTPIREALQRLGHSGLVDNELARGATVHTITPDDIRDIYELRLLLEPSALRQSAPHLSEDEIAEIEKTLNQAESALKDGDLQQLSIQNGKFHGWLVRHATNKILLDWLDSLSDRRRLISLQGWAIDNRSDRELEEHRGILAAIANGDFDAAAERLKQHIKNFAQIVVKDNPR